MTTRINLAQSLMRYEAYRVEAAPSPQQQALPPSRLRRLTSATQIATLLADAVKSARSAGDRRVETAGDRRVETAGDRRVETAGDRRAEAEALGLLGQLYTQQALLPNAAQGTQPASLSDAERLTRQSLQAAQSAQAIDLVGRSQGQLGRLLEQQGKLEEAFVAFNAAAVTFNSQRGDLAGLSLDVQGDVRDVAEPIYRKTIELALLLTQKAPPEAKTKALEVARQRLEDLQLRELDNFFREACLGGRRVALDKITDDPRNQSTVIIYPIVLPKQLYVIVKFPGQPLKLFEPPNTTQPKVEDTLKSLNSRVEKLKQVLNKAH